MSDWAIETQQLGCRFGDAWAVNGLDLQVPRGAVFGLLGENGAGKSTTMQMLTGLLLPDQGQASVLGFDPARDEVAVKSRVGYVPEKYGFYDYMRVTEIIAFVAAYHDNWNQELEQELLSDFELPAQTRVGDLSKGMRAKLALLLALAYEPDLLLLDEPAGGLDPASRRNFIETILGRYQQEGKTILLSSHLLNEFSGLIDHVGFIKNGRLDLVAPLPSLQQKMKRLRLVFEQGTPPQLRLDGALQVQLNGREAVATVADFEEEKTLAGLTVYQPTHVMVEDLSLEDMFIARLGRG